MNNKELEFTNYREFKRNKIKGEVEGLYEQPISGSADGKRFVRIMEFAAGSDTTRNGVQVHDYWEEIYIIEGSFIDLTLEKEFSKGMVASRPPGMKHGPWKSPNGCILFEVRYYLD